MKTMPSPPLTITHLRRAYQEDSTTPVAVIEQLLDRMGYADGREAWIHRRAPETLRAEARACLDAARDPAAWTTRPLLGIPFAVKDNIDVAGLPTTAGCPAYAYTPDQTATVVAKLLAAGAILVGKTNLDQFATGLVGTRSPYGAVKNPFHPEYMSGGSSSGSAAVVARGWVAFALGTDTAGSGRIPAGACNLVGLKPTPGLVSNSGVVPACRSLDCVSVFAHTVEDGWAVLNVLAGRDVRDPYSAPPTPLGPVVGPVRVGVPRSPEFHGDALAERAYRAALAAASAEPGVEYIPLDFAPFHAVGQLLYEGPWVAERRAAIAEFMDIHAHEMDPAVRAVIARADALSAADAFRGQYALADLRRACAAELGQVDLLLTPTAPTIYRHEQIAAEPMVLNNHLGLYTNFVNLLGLAALALPGPFRADGLPAGVTLLGPAGSDHRLAEFARRLQPRLHHRLGLSDARPSSGGEMLAPLPSQEPQVEVAVVGAHLSGLPLNGQLIERSARLLEATATAPEYRLYALPGTTPPKPGLVRVAAGGAALEVEVWALPERLFGGFVAAIPPPLGIGALKLVDGRHVKGFLCEAAAVADAPDVTAYGGWRAYLAAR